MLKKIHSVVYYVGCSLLFVMATDAFAAETGIASYYADRFQGRKTASGERYDRNKLTAAHRTLPIGTKIEVTNLKTQTSVIVTINDRGPYVGNRKLDLSYAAAKELGLVNPGVGQVAFNLISPRKNDDFEKIIPLEYSPGVLGQAKSEEEVIEAEEEIGIVESPVNASEPAKTDEPVKVHHKHSVKKDTAEVEKVASSKKSAHSDDDHHGADSKAKKLAEKAEKSASESKHKEHHSSKMAHADEDKQKSVKKSAETAEKTTHAHHNKEHEHKSAKVTHSDKDNQKQSGKSKKVAQSDSEKAKKTTKSKHV